jgi:hypothetical protein
VADDPNDRWEEPKSIPRRPDAVPINPGDLQPSSDPARRPRRPPPPPADPAGTSSRRLRREPPPPVTSPREGIPGPGPADGPGTTSGRLRRLPPPLPGEPPPPAPVAPPAPAAPRAVGDAEWAFGLVRAALDELLAVSYVPTGGGGLFRHIEGLPPDLGTRLIHLARYAAGLPLAERFPTRGALDELVRAAPASSDAEIVTGTRRLPRESLEELVVRLAHEVAAREAEVRRLEDKGAETRVRKDQLLEQKTARIDQLQARLSRYERERQQAEGLLRTIAEDAARSSQKSATRKLTRAELKPPDEADDPYDPTGTGKIVKG